MRNAARRLLAVLWRWLTFDPAARWANDTHLEDS